MHRIRVGAQTIPLTAPRRRPGIEPHHLLIDLDPLDNVEEVAVGR